MLALLFIGEFCDPWINVRGREEKIEIDGDLPQKFNWVQRVKIFVTLFRYPSRVGYFNFK